MSITMLCRVCLASNVRMHVILNTPLEEIYRKLTDISLSQTDGKSVLACYICCSFLKRCRMMMDKAVRAEELLVRIIQTGGLISETSLTALDRQTNNLTGGLCVSPIESIAAIEADIQTPDFKEEVPIKIEISELKHLKEVEEDTDTNHLDHHHSSSDSDDDVPLKSISSRKELPRVKKKQGGRRGEKATRGFTADFAREILLSKEEQVEELQARSKSLNYLNSPLKCQLCFKGFVDERAYENHNEKHDKRSGEHVCEICRMRYRTARQLRTHVATSHARRYACAACPHRAHTANQAREHHKWHNGFTYECKLCGQKFRKPTSYLTHMRMRHPSKHVCPMCGDSFVSRHGLAMHQSKAHHRRRRNSPDESGAEAKRSCAQCRVEFASVSAWKRHVLSTGHGVATDSRQCRICDVTQPTKAALATHLRQHERELKASRGAVVIRTKPNLVELACDQCGAYFGSRSKLHAHVKRMHLGLKYNKNVVCEVCGKKCTSNASLVYHQRTHTGEKPYQCDACTKRFADSNQLRIHNRTHTGERPYCCAACGKRFSQKPALNRHYRVHTGAKPYVCQFCSKTFSQSNSVKLHVRTVHLKMPPNNRRNKAQHPVAEDTKKIEDTVQLQAL